MTAFNKLYKICTDDYDNNEYLAEKYIRSFTNDIVSLVNATLSSKCNEVFSNATLSSLWNAKF